MPCKSAVRILPMANHSRSKQPRFQISFSNFSMFTSNSWPLSPFIESEWIGQGKKYDIAKIPEHVSEVKKKLLKMPDAVEAMIPYDTT